MTRVSNDTFYNRAFIDFRRSQLEIATLQTQIGSGKKLLQPSDDPAASAQVLNINETLARIDQYGRNATLANERLALEDSTLDGVTGLLTRLKELALGANSGTQSRETRRAFGSEVEQRLNELLDFANTRGANGDYLFAGFKAQTRPFERSAAGVVYNGDQGVRELQVSASRRVAAGDNGDEVFMRVPGGNGSFSVSAQGSNTGTGVMSPGSITDPTAFTHHSYSIRFTSDTTFDVVDDTLGATVAAAQTYTPGSGIRFDGIEVSIDGGPLSGDRFDIAPRPAQSMFDTVQRFVDAMAFNPAIPAEEAQQSQTMNDVIDSLDRAISHVLEVRTTVGARQNALESVEIEATNLDFELRRTRSELEDVDIEYAISRLQQQVNVLEVSQATFVRLADLSLFDFLR
jgi:flagellar hook-associated protein 3 FlgL